MSIMDLVPPRNTDANFSRINHELHAEIDQQINNFIACGGAIKEIPLGTVKNNESAPVCINEFNACKPNEYNDRVEKGKKGALANKRSDPSPLGMFPARSGTAKKSDYGMNIRKNKSGYFVVIGSTRFCDADQDLEAIRVIRDRVRATLNMPAAPY
jgi:hypothetical protein